MTDAEWYYAEAGEQKGPVPLAELRRLVSTKRVQPEDLVWCEGMDDWIPSHEVSALHAAKPNPKSVRKAEPSEAPASDLKPSLARVKPSSGDRAKPKSAKPASAPVESPPVQDPFPGLGTAADDEVGESDADDLDEAAEALFARPKFPAKRPRSSRGHETESRRESHREREIIREVTREVLVVNSGDTQLSTAALFVQLIGWVLCGLAVIATAAICAIRWVSASGAESSSTMLIAVSIGSFVLGRSSQRCLEILAAIKNK